MAQRALWRLIGAAAVGMLPVRTPAAMHGQLSRGLMRPIGVPQARLMTMFGSHRVVRMTTGANDGAAGERPAWWNSENATQRFGHDVSIRIGGGFGGGRCFGVSPRANTSMMIMRPPQHGHGRGRTQG